MSIPIPIAKENAEEKARRVRLLRIWTDICAMALCEMPEGRSENMVTIDMGGTRDAIFFYVIVRGRAIPHEEKLDFMLDASDPDAEERLEEIQRRLKPYVA